MKQAAKKRQKRYDEQKDSRMRVAFAPLSQCMKMQNPHFGGSHEKAHCAFVTILKLQPLLPKPKTRIQFAQLVVMDEQGVNVDMVITEKAWFFAMDEYNHAMEYDQRCKVTIETYGNNIVSRVTAN